MKIFPEKKMYLPAFSIVAVVGSLLLVISISTYRNIDREKKIHMDFIYRQGLTLLRSIEAGARSGMAIQLWGEDSLARLIQETGKDENISYIYLVDEKGVVVHHSIPSLEGTIAIWLPQILDPSEVVTRFRKNPDSSQVYDLAKRFFPKVENQHMMPHHMSHFHLHKDTIIVIGLSMQHFENARKADLHHAFIMAAIVLALGSGTIFFIVVIQNYYLVDKTLKHTRDYTRQVISNMANGLLSLDKNGKLVSYNNLALELLGLDESQVHQTDIDQMIDFKEAGINSTLNSCQKEIDRQIMYHKKSGEVIPLSFSSTPIESEPNVCEGVVILIRDLREIKALEKKVQESEKLAAIGKLAASLAHEVRNPLSSIKGLAQFLQHSMEKGNQQRQYAQIMVKEVDRINRVMNDLLAFSQPVRLDPSPTDVSDLIAHTVSLIKTDADSRHIAIRINSAPMLDHILLDENQMTQVLLNLLLNALIAVDDGGVINISAEKDKTDQNLLIRIEDNGSGIPPELLDKIFDPFVTTREKGTGIGLAITRKIVENHDGKIDVESPPADNRKGSAFTISIPIKTENNMG